MQTQREGPPGYAHLRQQRTLNNQLFRAARRPIGRPRETRVRRFGNPPAGAGVGEETLAGEGGHDGVPWADARPPSKHSAGHAASADAPRARLHHAVGPAIDVTQSQVGSSCLRKSDMDTPPLREGR